METSCNWLGKDDKINHCDTVFNPLETKQIQIVMTGAMQTEIEWYDEMYEVH